MGRRMVAVTAYLTPEQDSMLKMLHHETGVAVTEYIRRGVDMVLKEYSDVLPDDTGLNRRPGGSPPPREER